MMTLISPIALCLLLAIIHKISDDITVVTIKNLVQQGENIYFVFFVLLINILRGSLVRFKRKSNSQPQEVD